MVKVYHSEGMSHHVSKFLDLTGLQRLDHFNELDVPCIWMSLYNLDDYMRFRNHFGSKIIYWFGSDVLILLGVLKTQTMFGKPVSSEFLQSIVDGVDCRHVCQNELLKQELATIGIDALVRPLFLAPMDEFEDIYCPKSRPSVYTMVSGGRHEFYGVPWIYEIADQADVDFYIYGYEGEDTSNVFHFPYLPESEFNEQIKQHQAFLRLTEHDGVAQSVMKALLMGQYVCDRVDYPFVSHVSTPNDVLAFVNSLSSRTESNKDVELLTEVVNNFDWLESFKIENQDYVYWDDWDEVESISFSTRGDLIDKEIKGELDG